MSFPYALSESSRHIQYNEYLKIVQCYHYKHCTSFRLQQHYPYKTAEYLYNVFTFIDINI